MNSILTRFIRLLKEPLKLEEGIWLDNPRSQAEVDYWKKYLAYSQENGYLDKNVFDLTLPVTSDKGYNWLNTLKVFLDLSQADQLSNDLAEKDVFEILSKTLVVIRYDDFGFYAYQSKHINEIAKLLKTERDLPIVEKYFELYERHNEQLDRILTYSFLISLLNEENFGSENFILHTSSYNNLFRDMRIDSALNVNLGWWARNLVSEESRFDSEIYRLNRDPRFSEIILKAFSVFKKIDNDDLLKYAAESIKTSFEANTKFRVLTMVGLIEAFIIKKPDPNRYHIEDSIKKQFVLKLGLILMHKDATLDLSSTREKLRELYDQRSNIAHGNFLDFKKTALKSTLGEDTDDYEYKLASFAEICLRKVIWIYIEYNDKMNFIKNN